jgi:hypothetical protein
LTILRLLLFRSWITNGFDRDREIGNIDTQMAQLNPPSVDFGLPASRVPSNARQHNPRPNSFSAFGEHD